MLVYVLVVQARPDITRKFVCFYRRNCWCVLSQMFRYRCTCWVL